MVPAVQVTSKPPVRQRLLRLLPGQCAICHAWGRARLCAACLRRYDLPRLRCTCCGLVLASSGLSRCGRCTLHPPPLDRTVVALDYAFPWDGLLQRFKFQQALELRSVLVERLLPLIDQDLPDLILAAPISAPRLRERGYNQSQLLALALAKPLRRPCPDDLLLRVRDGAHQARLPLAERAGNVRGVFAVEPRRLSELEGQHVAIVDDVMTSGATLFEIARVLRAAGATRVQAWVIARTPE